jgi:hypothetical protein
MFYTSAEPFMVLLNVAIQFRRVCLVSVFLFNLPQTKDSFPSSVCAVVLSIPKSPKNNVGFHKMLQNIRNHDGVVPGYDVGEKEKAKQTIKQTNKQTNALQTPWCILTTDPIT